MPVISEETILQDLFEEKKIKWAETPRIYSTGVYLNPVQINGVWVWVAMDLNESDFLCGSGEEVDAQLSADTPEELIKHYEDDQCIKFMI